MGKKEREKEKIIEICVVCGGKKEVLISNFYKGGKL